MNQRLPDLEVYIKCPDISVIQHWLAEQLPSLTLLKEKKGKPITYIYQADHNGQRLPIVLVEKAAGGFASLWIDSNQSPWDNDEALATVLIKQLGLEIRFAKGGWSEGDAETEENETWIKLTPNGKREIQWQT